MISDCEGDQAVLLDPELVPQLRTAELIVELHPHVAPDIERQLLERFSATHFCEVIEAERRDVQAYPELAG